MKREDIDVESANLKKQIEVNKALLQEAARIIARYDGDERLPREVKREATQSVQNFPSSAPANGVPAKDRVN